SLTGGEGRKARGQNWRLRAQRRYRLTWRLPFLPFLPLPAFFFSPPPSSVRHAGVSLLLFLNRHEATLERSGMNSLQILWASPTHGFWEFFISSARCAVAGEPQTPSPNTSPAASSARCRYDPVFFIATTSP